MDLILKIAKFAVISGGIYLAIALVFILSQWPKGQVAGAGLHFDRMTLDHVPIEPDRFTARDGVEMNVRVRDGDGPLVVIVHGSGGHGAAYDWLAARIAQTGAQVVLPDLRGHFGAGGPRGDVAYIGQLEDDLADLVAAYRTEGQKVLMVGHSSGGGLVVRFAGGEQGAVLDGAVLLAPFLHHRAPTAREDTGDWAQPLVRRLIGLSMLNMVGITALNGLHVIEFNVPEGPLAETMTGAYSYRLNTSYAPRGDYLADVAALPKFHVIAGREDEAFLAAQYEPAMSGATDQGAYTLLDGVSHLDVFLNDQAAELVAEFIGEM